MKTVNTPLIRQAVIADTGAAVAVLAEAAR